MKFLPLPDPGDPLRDYVLRIRDLIEPLLNLTGDNVRTTVERRGKALVVSGVDTDESYAFKARKTGRLEVTLTAGSAYMVNEPAEDFDDTAVAIPDEAGTYCIYLRNEYGIGAANGTWGDIEVCLVDDLPAETNDDDRIIARNFRICTVTVTGDGDEARISALVQNWRWGDVTGYAPYQAPAE